MCRDLFKAFPFLSPLGLSSAVEYAGPPCSARESVHRGDGRRGETGRTWRKRNYGLPLPQHRAAGVLKNCLWQIIDVFSVQFYYRMQKKTTLGFFFFACEVFQSCSLLWTLIYNYSGTIIKSISINVV